MTANVFAPVPPVVDSVWLYTPPTVPPGKLAGLTAIAALISSEYARDPVAPRPSVAVSVKLNVPLAVAVPVKAPVDALSTRPAGSAPEQTLNVYVPLPPIAVIDWLYATPTVVAGKLAGAMAIPGLIVTV